MRSYVQHSVAVESECARTGTTKEGSLGAGIGGRVSISIMLVLGDRVSIIDIGGLMSEVVCGEGMSFLRCTLEPWWSGGR